MPSRHTIRVPKSRSRYVLDAPSSQQGEWAANDASMFAGKENFAQLNSTSRERWPVACSCRGLPRQQSSGGEEAAAHAARPSPVLGADRPRLCRPGWVQGPSAAKADAVSGSHDNSTTLKARTTSTRTSSPHTLESWPQVLNQQTNYYGETNSVHSTLCCSLSAGDGRCAPHAAAPEGPHPGHLDTSLVVQTMPRSMHWLARYEVDMLPVSRPKV